ncbi:hypothetical protein [Nocardia coffeae]|nr:hypothetical protein [Nocardia coffeae]
MAFRIAAPALLSVLGAVLWRTGLLARLGRKTTVRSVRPGAR